MHSQSVTVRTCTHPIRDDDADVFHRQDRATQISLSPPKTDFRKHNFKDDDSMSFTLSPPDKKKNKKKKKEKKRKFKDADSGDEKHSHREKKRHRKHDDDQAATPKPDKAKKKKKKKIKREETLDSRTSPVLERAMEGMETPSPAIVKPKHEQTEQDNKPDLERPRQGVRQVKIYPSIETSADEPHCSRENSVKEKADPTKPKASDSDPYEMKSFLRKKSKPGQLPVQDGHHAGGQYQMAKDVKKIPEGSTSRHDTRFTASASGQNVGEDAKWPGHQYQSTHEATLGAKDVPNLRSMEPPKRPETAQRHAKSGDKATDTIAPSRQSTVIERPSMKVNQFNHTRPHLESRIVVRPHGYCSCLALPRYFTFFKHRIPCLETWDGDEYEFYHHVQQIASCNGHPEAVKKECSRLLREKGAYWNPEVNAGVIRPQEYLSGPAEKEEVRVREQSSIAPQRFYRGYSEAGPSMPPPPRPTEPFSINGRERENSRAFNRPVNQRETTRSPSPLFFEDESTTPPVTAARPSGKATIVDLKNESPSPVQRRPKNFPIASPSPSAYRMRH